MRVLVMVLVVGLTLAGPIRETHDEDGGSGVATTEEPKLDDDGHDSPQPDEPSAESYWPFEDPWTFDTDWEIPGWGEESFDPDQPDSEKPRPYDTEQPKSEESERYYPERPDLEERDHYYPEQPDLEERDPYYPEESDLEEPEPSYPDQPDGEETEPQYPEREDGFTENHGGNQAAIQKQQQQQQAGQTMPVEEAAQHRETEEIVAGGSRPEVPGEVHPWYQEPAPNYQQYNYDREAYQYYNAHYYPPSGQIHYGSEGQYYQNPWAYNQHYLTNPDGSWVFNPFYNPEGDYYRKK